MLQNTFWVYLECYPFKRNTQNFGVIFVRRGVMKSIKFYFLKDWYSKKQSRSLASPSHTLPRSSWITSQVSHHPVTHLEKEVRTDGSTETSSSQLGATELLQFSFFKKIILSYLFCKCMCVLETWYECRDQRITQDRGIYQTESLIFSFQLCNY